MAVNVLLLCVSLQDILQNFTRVQLVYCHMEWIKIFYDQRFMG